nr:RebP-like cytochrome P450 [uncultured bacterium]
MSAVGSAPLAPFSVHGWTPGTLADPYPIYRRYREADPVHRVPGPTADDPATWYVFRHADLTDVLTSPRFDRGTTTRTGPMVPDGFPHLRALVDHWLVFMDPPRHTRLRTLLNKEFTPRVVAAMRPRVTAVAQRLVDRMRGPAEVDLVAEFAAPFPIEVIAELVGVSPDDQERFRAQVLRLREGIASRTGRRADGYQVAESAAAELVTHFRGEIERRRAAGAVDGRDLLTLLVDAQRRGEPLTDEDLVGTAVHLLIAGHETTTNLISKAVLALHRHPELADGLRERPEALPGAVEEFLRYDPPVQMVNRWAQPGARVAGHHTRPGDKLVLVLGSACRDPERFPDPDQLWPDRSGPRHTAFGAGIHYCMGTPLARLEAEIALGLLLHTVRLDRPVRPGNYAEDIVFHGPTSVLVQTNEAVSSTGGMP